MADIVNVTDKPVKVTSSTDEQDLRLAVDVSQFDELDLLLHMHAFNGTTITLKLETSMQNESTEGWVDAVTFSAVTSEGTAEAKNVTNFLRYVRWNVSAFTGTDATFTVQGMGRRWA